MKKLIRIGIGIGLAILTLGGIVRIITGFPLQGICGILASICLFPPIFKRIFPSHWKTFMTVLFISIGLFVFSPFPSHPVYQFISRRSNTATDVVTPSMDISRNTPPDTLPEETLISTPSESATESFSDENKIVKLPTPKPLHTPTISPAVTPITFPEGPFLKVICLDIGQGDATLVLHKDSSGREWSMIIDGGDRKTSSFVVARLSRLDVSHLDSMICTHYDADHTYGLIGCYVQYSDENTTVYCPGYVANTETYQKFQQRLNEGIVNVIHPKPSDTIPFGDCSILVLGPIDEYDSVENNRSIVLSVTYENHVFYFPGDAEFGEESAILSMGLLPKGPIDVYHVSHHGSQSANSKELLSHLKPRFCVISVGNPNPYLHPHDTVLNLIEQSGCENIYRTDQNGEVTFTVTDGNLSIAVEKNKTIQ